MLFSLILSVDVFGRHPIGPYLPSRKLRRRKLVQTEGDSCYEPPDSPDGKGHHRKLCGILNRKDFDQLVEDLDLHAESCETMGSIGAPGFGVGWAPAISFNSYNDDAYINMYVTPIPNVTPPEDEKAQKRAWDRIRKAILNVYR